MSLSEDLEHGKKGASVWVSPGPWDPDFKLQNDSGFVFNNNVLININHTQVLHSLRSYNIIFT
jgi:hypothetical protein